MINRKVTIAFVLGFSLFVKGTIGLCRAQQADSATKTPVTEPVAVDQVAEHELPEPYRHWKTHSGTPPECVASVYIEAQHTDSAVNVSGLVVRCDGFILIPRESYDRIRIKNGKATVSVIGAEGERITEPIPVAGWQLAAPGGRNPEYGLIKINGHHVRCLPLLSGTVIHEPMTVDVVYANNGDSHGTCHAVSVRANVLRVPEGSDRTSAHAEHYCLGDIVPSSGVTAESNTNLTEIPVGAAVIDDESGAAIGMVTKAGQQPVFATMAQFSRMFNDVPVASSRASIDARMASAKTVNRGMLHIPGGAIFLQGAVAEEYKTRFHTEVACMPDFAIDILPVTNGQYRTWMQDRGSGTPLPSTWRLTEVNDPVRQPELPVLGVTMDGARAYADDQDKRLVTEVEWQRAARIDTLDWAIDIQARITNFGAAYGSVEQNIEQERERRNFIASMEKGSRSTNIPDPETAPMPPDILEQMARLKKMVSTATSYSWIFGEVHPVGLYPYDISVYGVRDVATNLTEFLLPRGDQPAIGQKPFPAHVDPYLSYVVITLNGQTTKAYMLDISPSDEGYFYDRVVLGETGEAYESRSMYKTLFDGRGVRRSGEMVTSADYLIEPVVDHAFRCAR